MPRSVIEHVSGEVAGVCCRAGHTTHLRQNNRNFVTEQASALARPSCASQPATHTSHSVRLSVGPNEQRDPRLAHVLAQGERESSCSRSLAASTTLTQMQDQRCIGNSEGPIRLPPCSLLLGLCVCIPTEGKGQGSPTGC